MTKRMLIDALHPEETRVVIADNNQIVDFDFISAAKKQLKGNIYLAKITRVEPSLQAAFVEYGGGKQGFLPFAEIHPDYYQIPMSDRKRLMEEAESDSGSEEQQSDKPTGEEQQTSEQPQDNSNTQDAHPAYLTEGAIDESASSNALPELPPSIAETPEMSEQPVEASGEVQTTDLANAETGEATAIPASAVEGEAQADNHVEPKQQEDAKEEGVETLSNEEEEMRPRKKNFSRRYKIQEVIRRGQIVLVQVIKEERGNKGCSLTTYLSLAGRYCVLMPNSPKDGGISRKIMSPEDRKRLKAITNELRLANGMSVIIRTAGMDRTRTEIKRDYDYLVKVWNQIREDTLQSTAPALIYEESNLIKRALRDQYTSDIDELWIEGKEGYEAAKEFMKLLLPSHTSRIKLHDAPTPLLYAYNIEDQLLMMHDPVVKLKSGGYIVINPTEALISIDVNSGRSTGERNIEETAAKTNLEAAAEVARQLRLRDLAGLIVIDFIDMLESRNRRNVERALKDSLKLDRAKIQLGRISPFGLLEMSRQRLRPSISETNMVQCPHCIGRGYIRSNESMSIQLIRALEKEASSDNWGVLKLATPQAVGLHLLNTKRDILRGIEDRYDVVIQITIDPMLTTSDYSLEKMRRPQNDRSRRNDEQRPRRPEMTPEPAMEASDMGDEEPITEEAVRDDNITEVRGENDNRRERGERGGRGRNRRRRGRRGGSDRYPNNTGGQPQDSNVIDMQQPAVLEESSGNASSETEEFAQTSGEPGNSNDRDRPRRSRGGRGRRRWRNDRGERPANAPNGAVAVSADAHTLPAFTKEPINEPLTPPPPPEPRVASAALDSAPNDSASPKKGWWKKMIELDD